MPERILVIQVSRIGDTLLTTPALQALAARGATLTVIGHPKRGEVVQHLPGVERFIPATKHTVRWRGWLAPKTHDLALVYGFDAPLLAYARRVARRVVAYTQPDATLNQGLAATVPWPCPDAMHWVDRFGALAVAAGYPLQTHRIQYVVTPAERAAAQARLAAAGLADAFPRIGLQVASFPTKAHRDWPLDHFAQLCAALKRRWPQAGFLLYGGPDDRARTEGLAAQLNAAAAPGKPPVAVSFAGQVTLRESAAIMALSHLYVGVDTGPTHLMSAFDIPMVALYHCLYPSVIYGPLNHPCARTIDHPKSGQPGCSEQDAMAAITVDAVLDQIGQLMAHIRPR